MSNDSQLHIPADLERINFEDRDGLHYWLAELSCTRDALFSAIEEVGNYTKDVRSYLILKADHLPRPPVE